MVRFNKQTTLSNCGPTALLNSLKWAGLQVSTKDYKYLYRLTKTDKNGTLDKDLYNSFKVFTFWKIKALSPNITAMKKSLAEEKILVLGFPEFEYKKAVEVNGHYILVVGYHKGKFQVVNHVHPKFFNKVTKENKPYLMKTKCWITTRQMKYLLLPLEHDHQVETPVVWSLQIK